MSRVCRYQTRQYLNGIAFGNVIGWANTARETLGWIWIDSNDGDWKTERERCKSTLVEKFRRKNDDEREENNLDYCLIEYQKKETRGIKI